MTVKLTVQQIVDAVPVVAQIIRERRPMPEKGKYWLARMHAKLLPEYNTANERREAMIAAYDHKVKVPGPGDSEVEVNGVPLEKMPEFTAAWKEIGDQEIEADVTPVKLAHLDLGDAVDGGIHAGEFAVLGDLVTE